MKTFNTATGVFKDDGEGAALPIAARIGTEAAGQVRYKVAFTSVQDPKFAGQGHTTRYMAIRNALYRAGLLDAAGGPIEFYFVGLPDGGYSADNWPDADRLIVCPQNGEYPQDRESFENLKVDLPDVLGAMQLDLLLVDQDVDFVGNLIGALGRSPLYEDPDYARKGKKRNIVGWTMYYRDDRPKNVWLLTRYNPAGIFGDPMGHGGYPIYCLDRHYQIEPYHAHGLGWRHEYVLQRPRTAAEKAGDPDAGKPWAKPELSFEAWLDTDAAELVAEDYATGTLGLAPGERPAGSHRDFEQHRELLEHLRQKYFADLREQGHLTYPEWRERNQRYSSKLLPPVVNVDVDRVLSREKARAFLVERFGLNSERPIALVVGRSNHMDPADRASVEALTKPLEQDGNGQGYQVVRIGGGGGHGEYLPELYRYVGGADLIVAAAGYNLYYELHYLKGKGLCQAQLEFFAHKYSDQPWRASVHQGGLLHKAWQHPVLDDCSHHDGNGADELSYLIGRYLGLFPKE